MTINTVTTTLTDNSLAKLIPCPANVPAHRSWFRRRGAGGLYPGTWVAAIAWGSAKGG